MKHFTIYNISIFSAFDLTEHMLLLDEELGGNKALRECPSYNISLLPYQDYNQELLKECIRIAYYPLGKKEIWQDSSRSRTIEKTSDDILVRYGNSFTIFINNTDNIYSYLRSKLCEIIREYMLKHFPFGLHAALIGRNKELSLIIGAKGSGKTSSVLYAFNKGWDVYTDEFVLIDIDHIEVLERFPAISSEDKNNYFADSDFQLHSKIIGYLTGETKNIININMRKCENYSLSDISCIYVLTNHNNKKMLQDYSRHIFYNNFISNSHLTNEQYNIAQYLIFNSEMINIEELAKILQEEHNE